MKKPNPSLFHLFLLLAVEVAVTTLVAELVTVAVGLTFEAFSEEIQQKQRKKRRRKRTTKKKK